MASARVLARALAPTRDLRRGKSDQPARAQQLRASARVRTGGRTGPHSSRELRLFVGENNLRQLVSAGRVRPSIKRRIRVDDCGPVRYWIFGHFEQVKQLAVHVPHAGRALEANGADSVRRIADGEDVPRTALELRVIRVPDRALVVR